jgi:hypothetical protein
MPCLQERAGGGKEKKGHANAYDQKANDLIDRIGIAFRPPVGSRGEWGRPEKG